MMCYNILSLSSYFSLSNLNNERTALILIRACDRTAGYLENNFRTGALPRISSRTCAVFKSSLFNSKIS